MAARPSSRQWVGVGIVAIQMAAWCVVGVLLIHRGATNLRRQDSKPVLMVFMEVDSENETLGFNDSMEENSTLISPLQVPVSQPVPPPPSKAVTAIVMVVIGAIMLVVGPAFLLVKIVDVFQRQRRFIKLSTLGDPPPSYDEATEKAPRYSALFHIDADGSLSLVGSEPPQQTSQPLLQANSDLSQKSSSE